jgi:hypothetical protein
MCNLRIYALFLFVVDELLDNSYLLHNVAKHAEREKGGINFHR